MSSTITEVSNEGVVPPVDNGDVVESSENLEEVRTVVDEADELRGNSADADVFVKFI